MNGNERQGDLFKGTNFERTPEEVVKKRSYTKRNEHAADCSVCGRPLSDPTSVQMGIGPECFSQHIHDGKESYKNNLFMIDTFGSKKIASCTIQSVKENTILIIDLDDDDNLPSVTNSIDEILKYFNIDLTVMTVITKGSDGMYCRYSNGFKFLSWDEEEAINKV